jgi:hypothetical protein
MAAAGKLSFSGFGGSNGLDDLQIQISRIDLTSRVAKATDQGATLKWPPCFPPAPICRTALWMFRVPPWDLLGRPGKAFEMSAL